MRKTLFAAVIFAAISASATTRNVTCSGDITSALQTALTASVTGDIVSIGAGSCTISGAVNAPCTGWTVQGAGSSSTTITISGSGVLGMGCATTQRWTGTKLLITNVLAHGFFDIGGTSGSPWSFRIDNNSIWDNATPGNGTWSHWMWIEGPCAGNGCVIDHNNIQNKSGQVSAEVAGTGGDGSPRLVPGTATACGSADNCAGAVQWNKAMVFDNGSSQVYFEDNTLIMASGFQNNDMLDCQNGGRYVFRHNTITGDDIFNHGWDSVASSCIEITAYSNTFNNGSSTTGQTGVLFRGGTGLIYNNQFNASTNILLTNYRSNNSGANSCPQGYVQNNLCGTPHLCDGNNSADLNTAPSGTNHGWACFQQIGRGSGPNQWLGGANTYSYPLYQWGNCRNTTTGSCSGANVLAASVFNANGGSSDFTTTHIQANRDYYDFTTSFTGATGVGTGTLASRPSTCTAGVAYWATDTTPNTLYKCTGNAWSTYYTPYAYPHPLVSGACTTPPTASITTPAAGTVLGTINIQASASATCGSVAGVQYILDGSAIGSQQTVSPFTFSWNTQSVINGSHSLSCTVTDTASNVGSCGTVAITVNNPLPPAPAIGIFAFARQASPLQ